MDLEVGTSIKITNPNSCFCDKHGVIVEVLLDNRCKIKLDMGSMIAKPMAFRYEEFKILEGANHVK